MANTINQPSKNPTNKLTAATLAGAVVSVSGLVLRNLAPEWYDPDVLTAVLPIVVFAAGWFTSDAPNQIIIVNDGEGDTDA